MTTLHALAGTALEVALAHMLISAAVILPVLTILQVFEGWSAALRHRLLQAATILLLTLAFVPLVPSLSLQLATLPSDPSHQQQSAERPMVALDGSASPSRSSAPPATVPPSEPADVSPNVALALTATWLVGSAVLTGRLVLLVIGGVRLRRRSVPAGDRGCARFDACELAFCHGLSGPMTVGIVHPLVLLPENFQRSTSPAMVDAVIRHEAGHVRRRDNLDELLGQLLLTMFWFNPMLYLLHRHRIVEREAACDDLAVANGVSKRDYGLFLLKLAAGDRLPAALAVSVGANAKSRLKRRLEALFSTRRRHEPALSRSQRRRSLTALVGLCLVGIAFLPRPQVSVADDAAAAIETPGGRHAWPEALHVAVMAGDEETVMGLLGEMPPMEDALRQAALQAALIRSIEGRRMAMFELLLSAVPDWRGPDGSGGQVLSHAAHWWPDLIPDLLALGADPDGGGRFSPLTAAARNPDPRAMELLLEAGADPNVERAGIVPLMGPMLNGASRSMVANMERLIGAGADVNILTSEPAGGRAVLSPAMPPLLLAIEVGGLPFVELLLRHGADPNQTIDVTYEDGTRLLVSPLLLAEARESDRGRGPLVSALEAAGARHQPGTASLDELIAARTSGFPRAMPLGESDQREMIASIRGLADDLPAELAIEDSRKLITVERNGGRSFSGTLEPWPISDYRRKSYFVNCRSAPRPSPWECEIAKARFRQRLDADSRWFTVSGDLPEDDVRALIEAAQATFSGCTVTPRFVADVSPVYVVMMMDDHGQGAEIQLVRSRGDFVPATPAKTSGDCREEPPSRGGPGIIPAAGQSTG